MSIVSECVPCGGTKETRILGIWVEQTEGAKFWMKVFTDLKTRGCQDILIAVTDGPRTMDPGRTKHQGPRTATYL